VKPWPETIEIRLLGALRPSALARILVLVHVVAPVKNNYSLPFQLTDEDGRMEICADEVERAVREEQARFPMDYGAQLEQCDELMIAIESRELLLARAERIAKYFPREARELAELVKVCRNDTLEPHIVRTAVAPQIVVRVAERGQEE
jgi:hypothetical protein